MLDDNNILRQYNINLLSPSTLKRWYDLRNINELVNLIPFFKIKYWSVASDMHVNLATWIVAAFTS